MDNPSSKRWMECDRVKEDAFGFTLVNFSCLIHSGDRESDEPFVFAGQAQQVIFEILFYIKMPRKNSLGVVDKHHDEVESYMEKLMNTQNCCESQSNGSIDAEQNAESGSLEARKVRGPTLLKDIWNMSPGKRIDVQFNSRNQAIGKEGRKLSSFLGILARNPRLAPLNIEDWRHFDQDQKKRLVELVRRKFSISVRGEEFVKKSIGKKWKDYKCELRCTYMTKYKTKDALMKNRPKRIPMDQWIGLVSYWLSDKAKKRSQANRCNRTKQKMSHTGGSKSIGTLMAEKVKDGIEPTRAEIFILTHKKRKDGRPLDEESAKIVDMIQIKLNNGETCNEQPTGSVAWKGDVYSQVLGEERSGYVRGLGLGPTPSQLWGTKSNILSSNMTNEVVQMLEQELRELKKSKEKHDEEMDLMKQNQDKLVSELSFMRKVLNKYFPKELSMAQNFGSSFGQVHDTNSGFEQAHYVEKKIPTPQGNMFKPSGSIKPEDQASDFDVLLTGANETFHSFKGLNEGDERWHYNSDNPESSTYAAELALEALAGVISLASSETDIKYDEINGIMKDFDELDHLASTGLHLGDTKCMVIQEEPEAIICEKKNVDPKTGKGKKITVSVDDGIGTNTNLADFGDTKCMVIHKEPKVVIRGKKNVDPKTEKRKKSTASVDDITSLLKLVRKDNDDAVRKLAAEALASLATDAMQRRPGCPP